MGGFGGGFLTGMTYSMDSDPDPCEGKSPKTYYKCVTAAGHNVCSCNCPPGKKYLSIIDSCVDEDAGPSGPSASDAKSSKADAVDRGEAVTGEEATEEGGYYSPAAVEEREAAYSGTPEDEGSRGSMPTGVKTMTEPGKAWDYVDPDSSMGKLRELIEPTLEPEEFPIKDMTGRPGNVVRKFTVRKSSSELDAKANSGFYSRYRIDVLAEGGNEIRKDAYEVTYGFAERTKLISDFGLLLDGPEHQRLLNNAFLGFADEMLNTQVRSVESFNHISQYVLGNAEITPDYISEVNPSIATTVDRDIQRQAAKAERAGMFEQPRRQPKRAFRDRRGSPGSRDGKGLGLLGGMRPAGRRGDPYGMGAESGGHFSFFDYKAGSNMNRAAIAGAHFTAIGRGKAGGGPSPTIGQQRIGGRRLGGRGRGGGGRKSVFGIGRGRGGGGY